MKRFAVCLLLLFLTGCSESKELNEGMQLRSRLLQAETCSFSLGVHAESGQQLYSFSMDCRADSSGNIAFTVTQPATISGISGKLSASGGAVTFDDTALDFPLQAENQLSPVSAPWILMNTLRSGYITSACREDGSVRLSMDDSFEEDALRLDIWLDEARLPGHADVLENGRRILSLDVSNFVIV